MLIISIFVLLFASLINFYFSIQILRRVTSAEIKVSFFEIRWQVHKHMKKYREITRTQSGHVGLSWYGYWFSLALMIACGCWLFMILSSESKL